jgi:hypothetical protein
MRGRTFPWILLGAALVVLGTIPAAAFHDGGVAECAGCHSMHSPQDPLTAKLLLAPDPSSTCLLCHESASASQLSSYHIATDDPLMPAGTAPGNRTPGGDFGWIKKDYVWVVRGTNTTEDGDTHGHNIVAALQGYAVDARASNNQAPGGTFQNTDLSCISCHDPHGKFRRDDTGAILDGEGANSAEIVGNGSYNNSHVPAAGEAVGVYRLLAGNGYSVGGVTFQGVPVAVAPSTYNRTEAVTQTRVAYGFDNTAGQHVGWAEWCGTCHADMHSNGNYVHPTDETLGAIATTYKEYVKSGDMSGTSGDDASFLSLVPYAHGGATGSDYAALALIANNDGSNVTGPDGTDLVTCLSCHRAHASGFMFAMRWNAESEFLTYEGNWPGTDNGAPVQYARGRTAAEMQKAYYDRPSTLYATHQRSLCNKCHAQD